MADGPAGKRQIEGERDMAHELAYEWGGQVDDYNRYRIGIGCLRQPEDMEVRNMLYMVAYDIAEPGRLRRVAKTCEDFGVRVEKSVFECDLTEELFEALWLALISLIDEEDDAVVAYRICRTCVGHIESMGIVTRPLPRLYYYA